MGGEGKGRRGEGGGKGREGKKSEWVGEGGSEQNVHLPQLLFEN